MILFKVYHNQTTIRIDTKCSVNQYYNSLNYRCDSCTSSAKSPYACYANKTSIYTFKPITSFPNDCQDKYLTELDGDRRLLETPVCIEEDFDYRDIHDNYKVETQSGGVSTTLGSTSVQIYIYQVNELNYYEKSCLMGYYERGCDFAANLCALSLYNTISDDPFCRIIDRLNEELLNQSIL